MFISLFKICLLLVSTYTRAHSTRRPDCSQKWDAKLLLRFLHQRGAGPCIHRAVCPLLSPPPRTTAPTLPSSPGSKTAADFSYKVREQVLQVNPTCACKPGREKRMQMSLFSHSLLLPERGESLPLHHPHTPAPRHIQPCKGTTLLLTAAGSKSHRKINSWLCRTPAALSGERELASAWGGLWLALTERDV